MSPRLKARSGLQSRPSRPCVRGGGGGHVLLLLHFLLPARLCAMSAPAAAPTPAPTTAPSRPPSSPPIAAPLAPPIARPSISLPRSSRLAQPTRAAPTIKASDTFLSFIACS